MSNLVTDLRSAGLAAPPPSGRVRRSTRRWRTFAFHAFAGSLSAIWVLPILLVVVTSFRSFDDLAASGIASLPHSFTLAGYTSAWTDGGQGRAMLNSMLITVPALLLSLLLSAMAAFGLSRFDIPLRRTVLLLMLTGNLLPSQVMLIPITKIAEQLDVLDTYTALVFVHVTFGMGFYTFVLYGFMRSLPHEIQQAATLDGASTVQLFLRIVLPLTRPALAALGALAFTGIFNDLLWSITVLRTEGKMPITPALLGLQGAYLSNYGLIAAGTVIAAIPTLAVFLAFQKHFIGGLVLGSVK